MKALLGDPILELISSKFPIQETVGTNWLVRKGVKMCPTPHRVRILRAELCAKINQNFETKKLEIFIILCIQYLGALNFARLNANIADL